MQAAEKKQLKEVEALAKKGQHQAAKIVAKSVANTRKQVTNFYSYSAQLKGLAMNMGAMQTQTTMMHSMQGANKVMQKVNADMNIQEIASMCKEFQKE